MLTLLWINIYESIRNIMTAKLRAFLAILGIVVGTGSVVALISSSQLATDHALAQFKTLGTNLLSFYIQPSLDHSENTQQSAFTLSDVPQLYAASPQVKLVAPYISLFQQIIFNGQQYNGQVLGVTQSFFDVARLKLGKGRQVYDFDKQSYFCVIGYSLAEKFRQQGLDPLHQQILLGSHYFTVAGILAKWQPNLFIYADLNHGILIPLPVTYAISRQAQISNILVRLIQDPQLSAAQAAIKGRLEALFPDRQIQPRNPKQIINVVAKQRQTFSWLLTAIGAISLLVGAIGVMNIMLVSVVERRREIGIRMAIGAKQINILMLFLVESVMLTILGGIIGIILGVAVSYGVAAISGWEFEVFPMPIMMGFLVSVFVGILSGFYPAWRASRLDPIETLVAE